jgi:hypothetical protein
MVNDVLSHLPWWSHTYTWSEILNSPNNILGDQVDLSLVCKCYWWYDNVANMLQKKNGMDYVRSVKLKASICFSSDVAAAWCWCKISSNCNVLVLQFFLKIPLLVQPKQRTKARISHEGLQPKQYIMK